LVHHRIPTWGWRHSQLRTNDESEERPTRHVRRQHYKSALIVLQGDNGCPHNAPGSPGSKITASLCLSSSSMLSHKTTEAGERTCSISSVEAEVGRDLCCGSPVRKRSGVGMGPVPWWFYFVPSWRFGNSENRIIARPDCIISLSTMRLKGVLASLRHDYVCIRKLSTSENSTRLRTKMFSAF